MSNPAADATGALVRTGAPAGTTTTTPNPGRGNRRQGRGNGGRGRGNDAQSRTQQPNAHRTRNFIEAQGYKVDDSEFFQDNMSAMKMERNGRQSAGQRSRHINIRYFFIKDRISKGEINLIHCPTAIMIADYFTKPL